MGTIAQYIYNNKEISVFILFFFVKFCKMLANKKFSWKLKLFFLIKNI